MRRKLCLGLALATAAVLAGAFILTQTIGAQDAKKAEPEPKKGDQDLFDALRQKFEAKPDAAPALPLPTAQVGALPPLPTTQAPTPLPTQISPPGVATFPGPATEPKPMKEDKAPLPVKEPVGWTPPPATGERVPGVPSLPGSKGTPGGQLPPVPVQPQRMPPPEVNGDKPVPPIANPMPKEPIQHKGSVWSLYVEMVNGQTVVTATVNKKHEFKIVCQNIDLQTTAGVMKARGKVQISSEALNGSCDQLTLPLLEDRLVLEGAAEVRIQKVSSAQPAAFELKGDKLDLRISELRTSAYIETSWRKVSDDSSEVRTVPASLRPGDASKAWTTYGTLRKSKEANVWSLVSSGGQVIAHVMARDGGSLEQYVGRTIAVYGAREGERAGSPLVRVSHIAVP